MPVCFVKAVSTSSSAFVSEAAANTVMVLSFVVAPTGRSRTPCQPTITNAATPKIISEARRFPAFRCGYPPQQQTHKNAECRVDDPTVAHGHPRKRRRINGTADKSFCVRSKSE